MDQARFDELEKKKLDTGLTDEEANELGRLYAEKEGEPYANAEMRPEVEETPEAWKAEGEGQAVKEQEEAGEAAAVDTTEGPEGDHKPEEERAVGTERQPMAPTGAGYNPPKGSSEPVEEDDKPVEQRRNTA
ncbi:MAG TPA: hypothetical protein VKA30_12725 [Actinomycetota bacterium]|nr:hypothetical protein [Actinomycetota bacterium]